MKNIGVIRHCSAGKEAELIARAIMEVISATELSVDYALPKRVFDKMDISKLGFGLSGIVSEREDNIIHSFELLGFNN